ncbi:hypothetical protein E1H18_3862 [Caulobacter sp. RHG1]|nr:hypothetical protein [Caulobacter sp. RHG1]
MLESMADNAPPHCSNFGLGHLGEATVFASACLCTLAPYSP